MILFVVSNGAEYYDQRNETAFWDKFNWEKKKKFYCKLKKLNKGQRFFFYLKRRNFFNTKSQSFRN